MSIINNEKDTKEYLDKHTTTNPNSRKVTITERRVYHKVADIEIEVPDIIVRRKQVDEWLLDNEDKWEQALDDKFNDAELNWGHGIDKYDGMEDFENNSETRYDVINENYGGHL